MSNYYKMGIKCQDSNQLLLTGKDASIYAYQTAESTAQGIRRGFLAFFKKRRVTHEAMTHLLINHPNLEKSTIFKTLRSVSARDASVKNLIQDVKKINQRYSSNYCRTGLPNFNNTCFINSAVKLACLSIDSKYAIKAGRILESELQRLHQQEYSSGAERSYAQKEKTLNKLALVYAFIELQKRIKHGSSDNIDEIILNFIRRSIAYGKYEPQFRDLFDSRYPRGIKQQDSQQLYLLLSELLFQAKPDRFNVFCRTVHKKSARHEDNQFTAENHIFIVKVKDSTVPAIQAGVSLALEETTYSGKEGEISKSYYANLEELKRLTVCFKLVDWRVMIISGV
ncbi:hypothetical protein [Endozoicomonas atrinae]|uniref:hypothetical protein n=1 Tax=Endozoicomonas atrinae TaxID=1333660 RepID=UPI003B005D3A